MKEREQWFANLVELGCIVCLNEYGLKSPPDIHHIHKNSRRVSDLHTIPLCYYHHRAGLNNDTYASRHPWKKEFEKRYGSEWGSLGKNQGAGGGTAFKRSKSIVPLTTVSSTPV
jgi:hypothetical protein